MNQKTLELISDLTDDALKMDGYDDCIIGVSERFGQPNHIVYDLGKVLEKLVSQGLTEDEALEWYEFNMLGAYVGETTPSFLYTV
jgi:hypothetical protein